MHNLDFDDVRFAWQCVVGWALYMSGVPYHISSGIHGGVTLGYGNLDNNGFWQYPAPRRAYRGYEEWI